MGRYKALLNEAAKKYPRLKVRKRRDSWLQWIFTPLGFILRKNFSTYSTTIGSTIYVADDWYERTEDQKYKTLRHELVHVDQWHSFLLPAKLWFLNYPLFAFCYLFVLPARWTMRAKFEYPGYFQTLLVEWELGGTIPEWRMKLNANWLAHTFGGSAYFFMGNKNKTYQWAMDMQRRINAGEFPADPRRIEEPLAPSVEATPAST